MIYMQSMDLSGAQSFLTPNMTNSGLSYGRRLDRRRVLNSEDRPKNIQSNTLDLFKLCFMDITKW